MKKIVFLEPKSTHIHVYSSVPLPRLGTILLGTMLRERGYEVKVFIEDIAPIDRQALREADLVGISAITATAPRSYEWARIVRQMGIPTVLGGAHPSFLPEEGLQHAGFVVRGEGEETLMELVDALEGNGDLSGILGLSYRENGEMVHNPPRPFINDLDALPIPDFSLVEGAEQPRCVPVMTARGCPYNCSFCSVPILNGRKFRTVSVDRALEHLAHYSSNRRTRYVFFADDTFNLKADRMKELLRGMIDNRLLRRWGAQVRHEAARDDELLDLMRRSNCERVFVGFESINPRTLEAYGKKETVEDIEYAISRFHSHGIKVHGMFVLGSDEDGVETIGRTLAFAREKDIDSVQFLILTPVPGTPDFAFHETGERELLTKDWAVYDGHHAVHAPRNMTPYELQVETSKAMTNFYNLPAVVKRLVRFDFTDALIRMIGYRDTRRWDKQHAAYVQKLRSDLVERAEDLAGQSIPKRPSTIAITGLFGSDVLQERLEVFLRELGVKVVQSKKDLQSTVADRFETLARERERLSQSLSDYVSDLRGEVDYVVVLMARNIEAKSSRLSAALSELWAAVRSKWSWCPRLIPVQTDLDSFALRQRMTELGLVFTDDLGSIRRAYQKAMTQV